MEITRSKDVVVATTGAQRVEDEALRAGGVFTVQAHRNGELLWEETLLHNLIVNAGLTYLNGVALTGVTPVTTWYLGLLSSTPTVAAADTMASHAGWTEVVAYDEANRQTCVFVAGSAGAASNTASPAVFTISADSTQIGGVFCTSNNTKSGTTGTLFSGRAFTGGNRTLMDNDTLTVTYTVSVSPV